MAYSDVRFILEVLVILVSKLPLMHFIANR